MSFVRWRYLITALRTDWGYPWAVLSLEQGLTILLVILLVIQSSYAVWGVLEFES